MIKQDPDVWFSCGAASAVAAKLTLGERQNVVVVNCNTRPNEHPDNQRFFEDIQHWLGVEITTLTSSYASTVEQVFDKRRYMSGPHGAPCTVELKKVPRFNFQRADDIHVFGYTAEEVKRARRLEQQNPELTLWWPLIEHGIRKQDCKRMILDAGIALPAMYGLGYKNNNCLGCVKASAPAYWQAIKRDFPEVFEQRVKQSREIGCRLTRKKINGQWVHIFLDELEADNQYDFFEDLSCGPECQS